MDTLVNILSVVTPLCKVHVFLTEYFRVHNNSFLRSNVKSGNIATYWQPKNMYCKICVIPVIDNYYIFLTLKLFLPFSKGKIFLIRAFILNNHHKFYPSNFDLRAPNIKFFIQPLDV